MRKLSFVALIFAVVAAAAGCEDKATTPTPVVPTFSMALTSAQENPPIASLGSPEANCAGTVTIKLNVTRDAAQAITAATADFQINVTGCPTTTNITAAHIHRAPVGTNGGIVVFTGLASGELALTNGAGALAKNGVNITPLSTATEILDTPTAFYFNIHSVMHGGGVIRGQLVRTN